MEEDERYGAPMPGDDFDGGDPDDHDEPSSLREVIVTVAAALILAYVVQGYLVKPYRIPSGSMENTLRCGDRVLVDRLSWHFSDPKRGQVVVFHPPAGKDGQGRFDPSIVRGGGPELFAGSKSETVATKRADVNYIKRLIGLPGDTVEMHGGHTFVNGKRSKEPYLHPQLDRDDFGPVTLPKGTYLMMGDNRSNSADGRVFGPVPRKFLVGRAFTIYWPLDRIGLIPKREKGGAHASEDDPRCNEAGA
jgi:signal peptidase I